MGKNFFSAMAQKVIVIERESIKRNYPPEANKLSQKIYTFVSKTRENRYINFR